MNGHHEIFEFELPGIFRFRMAPWKTSLVSISTEKSFRCTIDICAIAQNKLLINSGRRKCFSSHYLAKLLTFQYPSTMTRIRLTIAQQKLLLAETDCGYSQKLCNGKITHDRKQATECYKEGQGSLDIFGILKYHQVRTLPN